MMKKEAPYHLVADGGSSKVDWALYGPRPQPVFRTEGMNPYVSNEAEMARTLKDFLLPQLGGYAGQVQSVHFYGAGCSTLANNRRLQGVLQAAFPQAQEVEVRHDLLGAARALCGQNKGMACILGTGSNCCRYDGEKITAALVSLGYLAGDEGSGNQIGKRLLQAYCYGTLPSDLQLAFQSYCKASPQGIVEELYASKRPNAFLASFAPFAQGHLDRPEMKKLVSGCFDDFIHKNVRPLHLGDEAPLHFVGSIAYHFRLLLSERVEAAGYTMGQVLRKPIEGLVHYHKMA